MFLGLSYLSNQYGLTVDNVAGYELVLPNGTVTIVTSDDDDLWFGLRVSSRHAQYRFVSLMAFNCREGSIISYAISS
jgi:FAD/FMN-containing dehydrogenase